MSKTYLKYGDAVYRAGFPVILPLGVFAAIYWHRFSFAIKRKCKNTQKMNTTPTTRRHSPTKPVRTAPVEVSKQATSAEALAFLNEFVKDARKEIRKRERLTIKGKLNETDCDSVTFLSETFSLTIDFKGGMAV